MKTVQCQTLQQDEDVRDLTSQMQALNLQLEDLKSSIYVHHQRLTVVAMERQDCLHAAFERVPA